MVDSKSFGLNSLYILTDIFFAVNTDLFAIPFDFLCNRDVGVYLSGTLSPDVRCIFDCANGSFRLKLPGEHGVRGRWKVLWES